MTSAPSARTATSSRPTAVSSTTYETSVGGSTGGPDERGVEGGEAGWSWLVLEVEAEGGDRVADEATAHARRGAERGGDGAVVEVADEAEHDGIALTLGQGADPGPQVAVGQPRAAAAVGASASSDGSSCGVVRRAARWWSMAQRCVIVSSHERRFRAWVSRG